MHYRIQDVKYPGLDNDIMAWFEETGMNRKDMLAPLQYGLPCATCLSLLASECGQDGIHRVNIQYKPIVSIPADAMRSQLAKSLHSKVVDEAQLAQRLHANFQVFCRALEMPVQTMSAYKHSRTHRRNKQAQITTEHNGLQ